jgi:hypothetical protein
MVSNAAACTKVHCCSFNASAATELYTLTDALALLYAPPLCPRLTPTLFYETVGRFFVRHSVYWATTNIQKGSQIPEESLHSYYNPLLAFSSVCPAE